MNAVEEALHDYDTGRFTAYDTVCKILTNVDSVGSLEVLNHLTPDLVHELRELISALDAGERMSGHWVPTSKQLDAAKLWLKARD
ncbi:hypothetical protein Pan44_31390 [Caulifigura coniformis]|uniref:Uncharacterized protein n=1 Tax=Caulifigura coniformis TaxID=2527983 RepID=A0A517SG45_9PLAN|nr:hypothetical protein Pan44_31390 [Caulifigura coniformis]